MDNKIVEFLEKRVESHDQKLEALTATTHNLALTATKHEEQLQIIVKIVYGCVGVVLMHFIYGLLMKWGGL